MAALEACFRLLAASPGLGGPLEGTAYRRHRQQAHIVVYRGVGDDIEIVRVLHAEMDLPARLATTD